MRQMYGGDGSTVLLGNARQIEPSPCLSHPKPQIIHHFSYVVTPFGKIENFTFVALEELLANAIVHNNYENGKEV